MKKTLAILLAALMLIGMFSFASAEAKTYKVGVPSTSSPTTS